MSGIGAYKQRLPSAEQALPGREQAMAINDCHAVLGGPLTGPYPGAAELVVGMGCFWGAERKFWALPGVLTTAVGYAGGHTANPTYREVCSGETGHSEVVRVVYDPARIQLPQLLKVFWESHDPTQGMRQGNDVGTQYRSVIYCGEDQLDEVERSRDAFQQRLTAAGYGPISTEIRAPAPPFYFAEDHHQQYLHKNPGGFCGLGGTGVSCPIGVVAE